MSKKELGDDICSLEKQFSHSTIYIFNNEKRTVDLGRFSSSPVISYTFLPGLFYLKLYVSSAS